MNKKTLSIKDQRAAELAQEVAKMMGGTMTQVVIEALKEKYVREKRKKERNIEALVEAGMAIAKHCSSLPLHDNRTAEEILGYDDDGLPTS